MKINNIYRVKIIDEDNIGNGIAKIDNFVIFVKNALLNEELEIKITDIKKNYANACILNIYKKSKYRENIPCKYYDLCGGCNFLHTSFLHEIEIKTNYLEKLFNRKIKYLDINNPYNYRNKVVLHVNKGILGLYNDKTHEVCEIDSCLLLNEKINLKIGDIKKYNLIDVNEIMIRVINNKVMISINSNKDDIDIKNIDCDSLYINNKHIKGEEYLIDEINNYKFSIYPNSFYQINKEGMINIYNEALNKIDKYNTLLDLYCGTGTIGIWLNKKFDNITGVEINKSSIHNANINKELNNLKSIKFICSDASNINGHFDVIVVDPPRSGLSKKVVNFLDKSNSKKIIYISCNPNTLKRDIDLLNNYEISDLCYTNMFPRTKHIECVSLLSQKNYKN